MQMTLRNPMKRKNELNMSKKPKKAIVFTDSRTGKRRCWIDPFDDAKVFARWLMYEGWVMDLEIIDIDSELPEMSCKRMLTQELPNLFARR